MPRVTFVKKARKDNPVAKAGESYYWWKFRYGGKRYSKTPPRPSQLTQSEYYGTIRALAEQTEDSNVEGAEDIELMIESTRSDIEELQQETQDKLDNMPENLQYSPTGELLQERVDALEGAVSDLDSIDYEFHFDEDDFDEDGYDSEEEMEEDRKEHERQEEERKADELENWLSDRKQEIIDAICNAEV